MTTQPQAPASAPVAKMDPDYVLEMFRFHMDVHDHNSDECGQDECDYCSWDNSDTWERVVGFGRSLDDWMSDGRRIPNAWMRWRTSDRPTDVGSAVWVVENDEGERIGLFQTFDDVLASRFYQVIGTRDAGAVHILKHLNGDRFETYREHVQSFERAAQSQQDTVQLDKGSERYRQLLHIYARSNPSARPLADTEAALKRLEELVGQLGITSVDHLDELVYDTFHATASKQLDNDDLPDLDFIEAHDELHDRADDQASGINNGGVQAQLAALLDAFGERQLTVKLHEIVGDSAPHDVPGNVDREDDRYEDCESGEPAATAQLDNELVVDVFSHGHLRVCHPYTGDECRLKFTAERGNVTVARLS